MFTIFLLAALALPLLNHATAQVIATDPNVPKGYLVDFATVSPPLSYSPSSYPIDTH